MATLTSLSRNHAVEIVLTTDGHGWTQIKTEEQEITRQSLPDSLLGVSLFSFFKPFPIRVYLCPSVVESVFNCIDSVKMIHFPAREMWPADVPILAFAIRRANECAFFGPDQDSDCAHVYSCLVCGVTEQFQQCLVAKYQMAIRELFVIVLLVLIQSGCRLN